jgi:hypothetical protein
VKLRLQEQLDERKQRIDVRLDKTRLNMPCPVISAANVDYELAERTRGIGCGGIGLMHQLVKRLELD